MKDIQYPVNFTFNIATLHNDFTAQDAEGRTLAYVKQKMFKLKEDISIYEDESQREVNYRIKANQWIDFSAAYTFLDKEGKTFGKVGRKGWKSLWKAEYHIMDDEDRKLYKIREENAWIKVLDTLLGEVPVLNLFTGYLFNPAYLVKNQDDQAVLKITKKPSLFGRKFELTKLQEFNPDDQSKVMLGLMMMVLLERRRG